VIPTALSFSTEIEAMKESLITLLPVVVLAVLIAGAIMFLMPYSPLGL
jgi:hypothetical protein